MLLGKCQEKAYGTSSRDLSEALRLCKLHTSIEPRMDDVGKEVHDLGESLVANICSTDSG